MRALIAIAVLLALPISTLAGPHRRLTAVPRAIGRSTANMFTFHDKWAALDEWLATGATLVDAYSTNDILIKQPGAKELNPILGGRPSGFRISLTMGAMALLQNSFIQYGHETCSQTRCYGLSHAPSALFTTLHLLGGIENLRSE